jgi:sugar phosphate isomerase/epimerase
VAVELALTPDGRWSASVDEYLDAAAGAGFRSVGLGAGRATPETATALAARGMRCHEVLSLMVRRDEAETEAQAHVVAEAAAAVGGSYVLSMFYTAPRPESLAMAARCVAILNEAGAKYAIEIGPNGPVSSISDGLQIVEAVGGPDRAGVMIDTWHFSHGRSTWEELAAIPLDHIAYVQFDDAPAWEADDLMHETMNRRLWPGEGILELDRFATTLLERGWSGTVSAEVLNAEYAELPLPEYCRQAWDSLSRYWA